MGEAGLRKLKYGKIAIVLFLTVLIWVWADLALDEEPPARSAVIVVDESADQELWVSFNQARRARIQVTLSGPHSAFVTLDRKLRDEGRELEFVFNAVHQKMSTPGGHTLRVLDFLQKDKRIKDLGLKVKSSEPQVVDVNVVALVQKTLPVECFDEDGLALKAESIVPSKVEMYVPQSARTAQAQLSDSEVAEARSTAVSKTPYVVLGDRQTKQATTLVKIKMPAEFSRLSDYPLTIVTLSVALSLNLQDKYRVEVVNLTQVLGPVAIRASAEAKRTYENQLQPQTTLYIFDDDTKKGESEQSRAVVYNFPEQFVRKGEIELKNPGQPVEARFRLIRLASPEAGPAVEE
jgi:hypothetical protein